MINQTVNSPAPEQISPENFNDFTYSKEKHFELFRRNRYDIELFGKEIDIRYCDLKAYQDLLVFSYIKQNLSEGSRILDVGGGESRILNYFKNTFECWNIDKLEGLGNGPKSIDASGIRLVCDYMGNFNEELPDEYFDLVFSISALEHVELDDYQGYKNILNDVNRVLKPGGYSIHCIDHCTDLLLDSVDEVWTNPIIPFFFQNENMINGFVSLETAEKDPGLFVMSENYYNDNWKSATGIAYEKFGKPFSYNFLWKKENSFLT